eukprot:gene8315-11249_t
MAKWKLELNRPLRSTSLVQHKKTAVSLALPNGLELDRKDIGDVDEPLMQPDAILAAKQRQAMNIAYGPGKALLQTAFMLWMSGSSIQIFSIMITGMALINPLKGIATINETFRMFDKEEGVDLKIPKLIYIALQILSFGVAVYKCSTMGLLPVTSADWVSKIPTKISSEISSIPL